MSRYPIRVKNDSGEEIPPWGIMVASGVERLPNNRIAILVKQISIPPTLEGRQMLLVNGPATIGITSSKRFGHARIPGAEPGWVRVDPLDGTPLPGSMWGVEHAGWALKKDAPGFRIYGLAHSNERVLASFVENPQGYFQLVEDLSAPSGITGTPTTAQAMLYTRFAGGVSLSGQVITLTNRWKDLSLSTGKGGWCVWDWTLMEWAIIASECP